MMHDIARGLHKAGLISKCRMRDFDALCYLEAEEMPPHYHPSPKIGLVYDRVPAWTRWMRASYRWKAARRYEGW